MYTSIDMYQFGALGTLSGYVLPSGDSVYLRIKVVIVTSANLTFSLGVIKVFE